MSTTLELSTPADKPFLAHLFRGNTYREQAHSPLGQCRTTVLASLDTFWHEPHHFAFVIREGDVPVGCVLVNRESKLHTDFCGHAVAALLVARAWRRRGIGSRAAYQVFDRFRGPWEVATIAVCVPQQAFWRSVMQHYTAGHYREVWLENDGWRGRVNSFVNVVSSRAE